MFWPAENHLTDWKTQRDTEEQMKRPAGKMFNPLLKKSSDIACFFKRNINFFVFVLEPPVWWLSPFEVVCQTLQMSWVAWYFGQCILLTEMQLAPKAESAVKMSLWDIKYHLGHKNIVQISKNNLKISACQKWMFFVCFSWGYPNLLTAHTKRGIYLLK